MNNVICVQFLKTFIEYKRFNSSVECKKIYSPLTTKYLTKQNNFKFESHKT